MGTARPCDRIIVHMKTALILPTAMGISKDEERINQFINGFKQVTELVTKYPEFDVFVTDNTIADVADLDPRLIEAIDAIPTLKGKAFFYSNEYGKKNKGAGLIVGWKGVLKEISKDYGYVISFEPRQKLDNYYFFEAYVANPGSYFRVIHEKVKRLKIIPIMVHQVLTGLVCFSRNDFETYCMNTDLENMVEKKISIEDDLYQFLLKNKSNFTTVEKLGVLWHDAANNRHLLL